MFKLFFLAQIFFYTFMEEKWHSSVLQLFIMLALPNYLYLVSPSTRRYRNTYFFCVIYLRSVLKMFTYLHTCI